MKKFLALALALVMALSLAACGKKADDNKGNGDEAKGSVYYLNFKPEADQALAGSGQDLHRADRRGGQGRHRRLRPV